LDLLCGPKAALPNLGQTVFLVSLSLSFAGAIFIAAICGLAALRWLFFRIKEKSLTARAFVFQAVKLAVIFSAVLVQTLAILRSNRGASDLDLLHRLMSVTRNFAIFPYPNPIWPQSIRSVLLGVVLWFFALKAARVPLKITVYFVAFSYLFAFYCSMATSPDHWASFKFDATTNRYFFTNYQIAAMLLCIVAMRLFHAGNFKRHIAILLTAAMAIPSLMTFEIPLRGVGFSYYYEHYIGYFTPNGTERMSIPTGPHRAWDFKLPVALAKKTIEEDLTFEVKDLSAYSYWNGLLWEVSAQVADGRLPERLWIFCENLYFPSRIAENGGFAIDTWHPLSRVR